MNDGIVSPTSATYSNPMNVHSKILNDTKPVPRTFLIGVIAGNHIHSFIHTFLHGTFLQTKYTSYVYNVTPKCE